MKVLSVTYNGRTHTFPVNNQEGNDESNVGDFFMWACVDVKEE